MVWNIAEGNPRFYCGNKVTSFVVYLQVDVDNYSGCLYLRCRLPDYGPCNALLLLAGKRQRTDQLQ